MRGIDRRMAFYISLLILPFLSLGWGSFLSRHEETKGPAMIKKELVKNGAFKVSKYKYVADYDQYKKYRNLKGLFFEGLPFNGKPTKIFCWYGVPETLKTGEKVPAVVLVHGGGGTVFADWVKKWNDHGYAAISIALEGQVPGEKVSEKEPFWPRLELSGPWRKGFFQDVSEKLENQWFFHAVADVILAHNLIRSFPEVDTLKTGITGISWGGIITNVVTGIDQRFAFSVPVYGCGFLGETPLYSRLIAALPEKAKQFYLQNWEPSLYMPLQKQPTLFVNGTNDCHFTMNSFIKTYQASASEKYLHIEKDMAHGHSPGWMPEEIYYFADYVTGKGIKPPEFSMKQSGKDKKLIYSFSGDVRSALLFYTNDTSDWTCKNYQWETAEAFVSGMDSTITATLPEHAVYYFLSGICGDDKMFSTPMKKVD